LLSYRSDLQETLGHLDEAIELKKRAIALDPLRSSYYSVLGYQLYEAERYDEANTVLQKALELNPQREFTHNILGLIFLARGHPQEALVEIQQEASDWAKMTDEALVYHALGRHQASDAALRELIATYAHDSAYQIAEVYAYRGEIDEAFKWLDRAYNQHDPGLVGLKVEPLLKSLHQDPRYIELLKKMRLPL
jgi:tetratricopeptide (TPR) repeat protein